VGAVKTRSGLFAAALAAASAAIGAQTVAPDLPAGSAREAELARRAAAIVEAFTDSNAAFTRDGRSVVFSSNRDGLPQLYLAPVARPEAAPSRILKTSKRILQALPLSDGKTLLFQSDQGADENWSLFRCGLDGSALTELTPGVTRQRDFPFVSDGMAKTAFYSARQSAESGSALYALDLFGGSSERKLFANEVPGFLFDVRSDGGRALWLRYPTRTDNSLLAIDLAKGASTTVYPPPGGPKVNVWNAVFSRDGKRIFVATDGGSEQALLLALDAATGKELARYAESKPATAEIESLVISRKGDRIGMSLGAGNHTVVRILDAANLNPVVEASLPLGTGSIGEFSEDGAALAATWSTPNSPNEIYAIDPRTGKASALRKEPRPTLAGFPNVEASIAAVPAYDGLTLPTNVYLPEGGSARRPVLVVYHGGPAGSSAIRWSPTARFFTSLGWAVVEPNVRGSGGFGRAFEMADNGGKRPEALRDVETTARWAAAQPWADPDRMVVWGGSYGGYTVLIALERSPEIWRAGVDLFGVANLATFLQSTNGVIREIFKVEFGELGMDDAFLKTISPIEGVDRITDPLFVYAGANDPRVPRSESDQIVAALRARGVPVEYMVAENEGHSLSRRENTVALFSRAARFLETQLERPR
jgi:dipeptidyl aminopeptidase/acylaminoacyl peptidase